MRARGKVQQSNLVTDFHMNNQIQVLKAKERQSKLKLEPVDAEAEKSNRKEAEGKEGDKGISMEDNYFDHDYEDEEHLFSIL